jgi:A/G-specific adenine glycosylase
MSKAFSARLLAWYTVHQRRLPWRGARDPYRIWVSEIMLQQTQVDTVIPYYRRWCKRFPTVRALAAAPQEEALRLWEGLGYYARARNLHRAAQQIVHEHAGRIPRTCDELRRLPGIGRYTAGAIASIAFGVDAAVLDGNVKRVLARVFDFREDIKSARGEKKLWALAESLAPAGQAGDYNQALMDLGATVCTPLTPNCGACPVRTLCAAYKLGVQLERPVTRKRSPLPSKVLAAGVIRKNGRVLIRQRSATGLLGGLWSFPSGAPNTRRSLPVALRQVVSEELGMKIDVGRPVQTLRHTFSHFQLVLHVFDCRWQSGRLRLAARAPTKCKWVRVAELSDYPMGRPDRQIARWLQSERL